MAAVSYLRDAWPMTGASVTMTVASIEQAVTRELGLLGVTLPSTRRVGAITWAMGYTFHSNVVPSSLFDQIMHDTAQNILISVPNPDSPLDVSIDYDPGAAEYRFMVYVDAGPGPSET